MKKLFMIIMAVALIALPTMAQQQEWKSTSTMQGTGSSYSPQVNAVGATAVGDMATTTESYSPAKAPGGPRRGFDNTPNPGTGNPGSPIGDAVLPMLLCAACFAMFVYFRRKQTLKS